MTPFANVQAPRAALWLGWAGVVPFVLLAAVVFVRMEEPYAAALRAYGLAILAFMGGVHWGIAMTTAPGPTAPRPAARRREGFLVSVVPALVGWFSLALPLGIGLVALAIAFAGLAVYDVAAARRGITPLWYGPLRVQLSMVVILALMAPGLVLIGAI